ncbi:unnamed protein product [Clonostachys byssicola]|uniref:NAD(P)-binding protein n=1 Tax=Clonostachys byssicola TaxID=160290 RepID=A0A9N9UUG3_9HYPO|nr:unnamed protein product [Clonostachys byssicola]
MGHALIIGGGGGIGGACCLGLARHGVTGMVVADCDLEAASRVAAESKAASTDPAFKAESIEVDVTAEESVARAVSKAQQILGRIDCCIIAAGIGALGAVEISQMEAAEFTRFLHVNVTGTFLSLKHVSAAMKEQEARSVSEASPGRGVTRGVIVNIASATSHVAQPGIAQYVTSKHAVLGLTKTAALDNVKHGIRINCVCPTWVDTPMVRAAMEGIPELRNLITNSVPMGRIALKEELADIVTFLAGPGSSYMTGESIIMDGGATLTMQH